MWIGFLGRRSSAGLDVRRRFEEQRAEMSWRPPVTGQVRRPNKVGVTARAIGMTGLLAAERAIRQGSAVFQTGRQDTRDVMRGAEGRVSRSEYDVCIEGRRDEGTKQYGCYSRL
jgi:hypothetical protein